MIRLILLFCWLLGTQISDGVPMDLPTYYLNLDRMPQRSIDMEKHLRELHVTYYKRISALTPETCNLIMVETPCFRVKHMDIAILCSHVNALSIALSDPDSKAQKASHFLILEDDVRFQWIVDFQKLIAAAPKGFGSLQLMLSHKVQIEEMWQRYANNSIQSTLFTPRTRNSSVWSAQAILYSKEAIRSFISKAVTVDRNGKKGFKLINAFQYDKLSSSNINAYRPAIASDCMFADFFLYAMAQPAFILHVPLFNSGRGGLNSSIHQEHVVYHMHGFAKLESIHEAMTNGSVPKPSFLLETVKDNSSDEGESWASLARRNQLQKLAASKQFNFS